MSTRVLAEPRHREPVYIQEFYLHHAVASALWGQILKDAEFFEPDEARTFVYLLGKLGYMPDDPHRPLAKEYDKLVSRAKTCGTGDLDLCP